MLEKNKNKENKRLIPLRRFAEVGPYGSAYLSNLVQRKSLKAKKLAAIISPLKNGLMNI